MALTNIEVSARRQYYSVLVIIPYWRRTEYSQLHRNNATHDHFYLLFEGDVRDMVSVLSLVYIKATQMEVYLRAAPLHSSLFFWCQRNIN